MDWKHNAIRVTERSILHAYPGARVTPHMQMCVTGAQTGEGNASSDGDFMKARNHPIQERGTQAQHFHVTTSEIKSTLNEIRHGIDELPSRRLSSARIPVESFVTDTSLRVGSEFASTSRLDRERSCSVADGSVLLKGGSEPFLEEGSIWVGRTLGSTMPENQSRQHSASNSLQPESAIDSIGFSKAIRSIECLENGVEVGDRESNLLVLHETPVHSPGRAANLTASRDSPIKDETIMQVNCSVDRVCEIERVAINKEKSSDRVENFRGPLGSKKAAGSTEENCSHEDVWECHPSLVLLHVYDLTPNISKYVNTVMRPLGAGAFHAGVEVFGDEYCFGRTNGNSRGNGAFCLTASIWQFTTEVYILLYNFKSSCTYANSHDIESFQKIVASMIKICILLLLAFRRLNWYYSK